MAKRLYWTHPSVKALTAGSDRDPTEIITERATEITLAAMQKGWGGPPFDPIALADFLKIRVEAREDVAEARTVPFGSKVVVQFNPNRPKARVKYSLCHELAHTLFPDCRERIRNRLSHATAKGDDWQLEMLCNIAAAEFAMPVGSLPEITDRRLDIDRILELRKEYAVSSEAMLLRLAKLTDQQCSCFCASREIAPSQNAARYLLNYSKPSRTWSGIALKRGTVLPEPTVVSECTAIGYTARGHEDWAELGTVKVECVGVTPYPNDMFPRVVGLLRPVRQSALRLPSIAFLRGDASEPRGDGVRLVVQIVNDSALTWGAGFSLTLRKKWPALQHDFRRWATERRNLKLGNVHLGQVNENLLVASVVAQHGYGPSPSPRIRYLALRNSLQKVGEIATRRSATVHMPRIGCGLAQGSWNVVGEIIKETIHAQGVKVFVYDLPNKELTEPPQTDLQFGTSI